MENFVASPDAGQNVTQSGSVTEKQDDPQQPLHVTHPDAQAAVIRSSIGNLEDEDEPSILCDGEAEECELDDDLDHDLVRQEAWAICRVRELAKACARLSGRLLPTAAERAARRVARYAARVGGFPPEPEPLTSLEVSALQVALQEAAAATAFPHSGQPTPEGVAAVEQLAAQALEGIDLTGPPPAPTAVEGAGPGGAAGGPSPWLGPGEGGGGGEEGISVDLLLRAGPERLAALSSGLVCLLRRSLVPCNCFGQLLLGRRLGCSELAESAMLAALANFPVAVAADQAHFLQLDDSSLRLITSNSNLQVAQELDVWQAIAEWVGYAWESRRGHLFDLLQAGVRLSALDSLQLSQLQRHPLLAAEPGPAGQLVGAAYSARILANVHRSRSRQRGGGAAVAGGSADTAAAGPGLGSYVGPDSQRHHHKHHLQQPLQGQQQQHHQQQGNQGHRLQPQLPAEAQQQPAHGHQQQPKLQQRPKPHVALQHLIGSLQARAAAAKAKQQQQQLLLQQQQQRQHQTAAAGSVAVREGQPPYSGRAVDGPSSTPPRSPLRLSEEDPAAPLGPLPRMFIKQEPGSSFSPGPAPGANPHAAAGPALSVALQGGGIGTLTSPGQALAPEAFLVGGGGNLATLPQRRSSPGLLLPQQPGDAAAAAGSGGGNGSGGVDKRQLASMLAHAIAKAAARQGMPRIQLGADGKVTPGAVQAALSAAQRQMAANPELQEMLREAKAQVALAQRQPQEQEQPQPYQHQHQEAHPTPLPPGDRSPGHPRAAPTAAAAVSSPPAFSSPSALSRAVSPGLASSLLPPSSISPHPGQQQEPGRPPPLPTALAPQQLLQIAAAVQRAVRSGQPQPPHVRQQLQQLQAFISRQMAASPADSPQQPLLLTLQSMLAGAATTATTSEAATALPQGPQQQQQLSGSGAEQQTQQPLTEVHAVDPDAVAMGAGAADQQQRQPQSQSHREQQQQQQHLQQPPPPQQQQQQGAWVHGEGSADRGQDATAQGRSGTEGASVREAERVAAGSGVEQAGLEEPDAKRRRQG